MKTLLMLANLLSAIMVVSAIAQEKFETDTIKTLAGDLKIRAVRQIPEEHSTP